MANIDPWYMKVPLADLKTDPKVQASYARLVEQYKAAKKPVEITDEQLEKFEVDVKEWESEQGFREVNKEVNEAREHFIHYSQNKDKYTAEERAMLERDIQKGMVKAQGTADMYTKNEETFDSLMTKIREQKDLNKEKRTIDVDKSTEDLLSIFQEGDVRSRNKALNKYSFTTKAAQINEQETWTKAFKSVAWGEDQRKMVTEDPKTGKIITTSETGMSDERVREANEKVFDNLPAVQKEQYRSTYEADPNKGDKTFKEWTIEKYSPIMAKKELDQVRYEGKRGIGTGPTLDKDNNVLWTKPTKDMKDPVYGEAAVGFQSGGSLNLNNLFSKPASAIYLPVTNNTTKPSTGDMEKGYVGEELLSLPISVNFYQVATKKMKIKGYQEIPAGEKISADMKKVIDKANEKAGKQIYQYENKPFLLMNTQFKGVEVTDEYDIKSFKRTHEVPYEDIKDRLTTLPGFRVYDEEITKKQNELNFTEDPYSDIFF